MMTTILLLLAQECIEDCPSEKMHPRSMDHTAGGSCRTCKASIDVCYRSCWDCAVREGRCAGCGAKPVQPANSWTGNDGRFEKPEYFRIATAEAWKELWKRSGRKDGLPAVDFEKHMILAVIRGTTKSGLEFRSFRDHGDRLILTFATRDPKCGNEPETSPYAFYLVPRSKLPVVVDHVRHVPNGEAPTRTTVARHP
jgi:hypothetical protein